jgi:hypothetical protein
MQPGVPVTAHPRVEAIGITILERVVRRVLIRIESAGKVDRIGRHEASGRRVVIARAIVVLGVDVELTARERGGADERRAESCGCTERCIAEHPFGGSGGSDPRERRVAAIGSLTKLFAPAVSTSISSGSMPARYCRAIPDELSAITVVPSCWYDVAWPWAVLLHASAS